MSILSKVFGDYNEKELKKLWPIVKEVNAFEDDVQPLSDDELRAKTDEFRERLDDGETLLGLRFRWHSTISAPSSRPSSQTPFKTHDLPHLCLSYHVVSKTAKEFLQPVRQ
ncbi:MAG: hypothetical protein IH863_05055 [Chloroflexi bacterium]|nr:hypothetical protein [Chloroflexota bacterium]